MRMPLRPSTTGRVPREAPVTLVGVAAPTVWRLRLPLAALGAVALAAALALFLIGRQRGDRPVESFADLLSAGRPFAARLSFADADVHHPMRAGGPARRPRVDRLLARLDRLGQPSGVVAAYLLAGGLQQARAHAYRLPPSPAALSDRAAVELEAGHPAQALALVERSLATPRPQAAWNQALARERLGFPLAAAASFDEVAAAAEPGWAGEARARAAALRTAEADRLARAREVDEAAAELHARYRVPPPALVARNPELWREHLYEALRRATGAPRFDALAALADRLDGIFGGTLLRRQLERARRGGARGAAASRALAASPTLITARHNVERADLVAAIRYARETGDDWLEIRADGALAVQDAISGDAFGATRRLQALVDRCLAAGFRRLCEEQRLRRSWVLDFRHTFAEAVESSQAARGNARALADQPLERIALVRLAYHAAGLTEPGEVRAIFAELTAMTEESCEIRGLMVLLLANIALREHDLEGVRRELKAGAACPEHLGVGGANVLRALVAAGGTHEEHELLIQTLAALRRQGGEPPARELMLAALEARLLAPTPERTLERLRRLRPASLALPDDDWSVSARLLIHLPLVSDAVARGNHRLAFTLFLAMLRVPWPTDDRCWLGLAVDGASATAVVRDRQTLLGEALPAEPLMRGGQVGLSAALSTALSRCREIAVLTIGELYGRPGLLPPEWAWAYAGPSPRTGPATPPRLASSRVRLVIADVPTPPELDLDPLAPWTAHPRPSTELVYRGGPDATPTEILRRAPEADEIDFHVHGVLDRALSTAPYLVLAPDPGGRYALTAEAVRNVPLWRRSPVVLLAACEAARRGEGGRGSWSLPRAFLEAGARAVVAAPSDIPDAEAGAFFEEISDALDRAASAAAAVQQVRHRHASPARAGRAPWFDDIIVFEG
jgi:cellulose synthase operon protein C